MKPQWRMLADSARASGGYPTWNPSWTYPQLQEVVIRLQLGCTADQLDCFLRENLSEGQMQGTTVDSVFIADGLLWRCTSGVRSQCHVHSRFKLHPIIWAILCFECAACAANAASEGKRWMEAEVREFARNTAGCEGDEWKQKAQSIVKAMSFADPVGWKDFRLQVRALAIEVKKEMREVGEEKCGEFVEYGGDGAAHSFVTIQREAPFVQSHTWARNLHILDRLAPSAVGALVRELFCDCTTRQQFNAVAKRVSVFAKASREIVPAATFFVDWHRNYGYLPPLEPEELRESAVSWLGTPHQYSPGIDYEWHGLMVLHIHDRLSDGKRDLTTADIENVERWFFKSRVWGTPGASDPLNWNPTTREYSGREVRLLKKTKNSLAATITEPQLRKVFSGICKREELIIAPKLEPGKQRHILRTDDRTYLHDAFIGLFLQRMNQPTSTQALTNPITANAVDWQQCMRRVQERVRDGTCNVPLDHSKFDEHQSLIVVKACVFMINQLVEKAVRQRSELATTACRRASAIHAMAARLRTNSRLDVGYHKGGLPSGWRWTALANTMLNQALNEVAWQISAPHVPLLSRHYLGDDSLIQVDREHMIEAGRVCWLLQCVGYELNPEKNYLSSRTCDFLGFSFTTRGISGSFSRSCQGLSTRNFMSGLHLRANADVAAVLNKWLTTFTRGEGLLDEKNIKRMVARSLPPYYPLRDVAAYMSTPTEWGGLGMGDAWKILFFTRAPGMRKFKQTGEDFSPRFSIVPPTPAIPATDKVGQAAFATYVNSLSGGDDVTDPKRQRLTAFDIGTSARLRAPQQGNWQVSAPEWLDGYPSQFSDPARRGRLREWLSDTRKVSGWAELLCSTNVLQMSPASARQLALLRWHRCSEHVCVAWAMNEFPVKTRYAISDELSFKFPSKTSRLTSYSALCSRNVNMYRWRAAVAMLPVRNVPELASSMWTRERAPAARML